MTAPIEHYLEAFSAQSANLPGQEISWLKQFRDAAINEFSSLGFPTTRRFAGPRVTFLF